MAELKRHMDVLERVLTVASQPLSSTNSLTNKIRTLYGYSPCCHAGFDQRHC